MHGVPSHIPRPSTLFPCWYCSCRTLRHPGYPCRERIQSKADDARDEGAALHAPASGLGVELFQNGSSDSRLGMVLHSPRELEKSNSVSGCSRHGLDLSYFTQNHSLKTVRRAVGSHPRYRIDPFSSRVGPSPRDRARWIY